MKTEREIRNKFDEWRLEKHNMMCVRTAFDEDWASMRRRAAVLDKRLKLLLWVLEDKEIFHDTEF